MLLIYILMNLNQLQYYEINLSLKYAWLANVWQSCRFVHA